MKRIILFVFVGTFLCCVSQKGVAQTACRSYVDKLMEKKPLPQKTTSDWNQFVKWRADKKVRDAYVLEKADGGDIRTTRMIRCTPDSVVMLQRVESLEYECDYAITPYNTTHPERFKRGFPIGGDGDATSGEDREIVQKLIHLFEK